MALNPATGDHARRTRFGRQSQNQITISQSQGAKNEDDNECRSLAGRDTATIPQHWTSRRLNGIIFIICALAALGVYLAFVFPSPSFPATNFPRIVVGVDNGVMPIDQMQVTITRPIEEAVNSVPGLDRVLSITSRGTSGIDLFFTWNVDMFQTCST